MIRLFPFLPAYRVVFSVILKATTSTQIANSPNVGICLCCGTWLEGGRQLTGKDPEEMIRYFGPEDLEDPLSQRQRAAPPFRGNIHG